MNLQITKTSLSRILPLRALFLQEANHQVRYDACHARGWSDTYLLTADQEGIGYGSVKGRDSLDERDAVFEFYLLPHYRRLAAQAFSELLELSRASFIECQSNGLFLSSLLYEFGHNISSNTILFEDGAVTRLHNPGTVFRLKTEEDFIPWLGDQDIGDYVLEYEGDIVGAGDFLLHYNPPFADLFMEVDEEYRHRGFGAYLLQELKKACYRAGRVPAARCHIANKASRACLLRAGFRVAGYMLTGEVRK